MLRPHSRIGNGGKRRLPLIVATAVAILAVPTLAKAAPFVYVTNSGEDANDVSQYDIGTGGLLSPLAPTMVDADFVPFGVAVSPDGASVYVANQATFNVSQYDVGAGGGLSPKSPATVAAGENPFEVTVSPDGRSVYVTNSFEQRRLPVRRRRGRGTFAQEPRHGGRRRRPLGVAVSPDGQSVYVANSEGDTSPSTTSARAGALAEEPGHAWPPARPGRGGGEPGRPERLRHQLLRHRVSQYDVGAGGGLSPKSPATVAAGGRPRTGWR